MTASDAGAMYPTREAVRAGEYERAALRLLYGFLSALDDTAPEAREELLHLLTERTSSHRSLGERHRGGAR